jgi:hypothetical protein
LADMDKIYTTALVLILSTLLSVILGHQNTGIRYTADFLRSINNTSQPALLCNDACLKLGLCKSLNSSKAYIRKHRGTKGTARRLNRKALGPIRFIASKIKNGHRDTKLVRVHSIQLQHLCLFSIFDAMCRIGP